MQLFCVLLRLALVAFVYALSVQDAREIIAEIATNGASPVGSKRLPYSSVTVDEIFDGKRHSDAQMPVVLTMSFYDLTELSPNVGHLTSLRELQLSKNRLTSLPDSICRLVNLEVIWMDSNSIEELPECIGELRKLRSIHAAGNKLTRLPESIRNLRKLETLDVSHNQLTALPYSICEFDETTGSPVLPNLRELVLYRNPLNEEDVLKHCRRAEKVQRLLVRI